MDASTAMVEAAAVLGRPVPTLAAKARVWPWLSSVGIGLSIALGVWGASKHDVGWIAGAGPGLYMGWLAAAALLGSVAYGGLRRKRWPMGRGAHGLGLHGILGALAGGAAWAHGGGRFVGTPGVLAGVLLLAVTLGMFGLVAYRALPSRLTRLEASAPADPQAGAESDRADALMRAVGGRSDALKRLTSAVLLPYARRIGGGLMLLLSGRSLAQEQQRLRARIAAQLGSDRVDAMEGLEDVLAAVVDARAAIPRRVLRVLLRGWLAPHIVCSALSLVLLAVHVYAKVAR